MTCDDYCNNHGCHQGPGCVARVTPCCNHDCNEGRDCPARKGIAMPLSKKRPTINAAPGLGWLILVPITALMVLLATFPDEILRTIRGWGVLS